MLARSKVTAHPRDFCKGNMDLSELIIDVARAKIDLAELQRDESITAERLAPCNAAARNLEELTSELLTKAWVPRDPKELLAAIQCTSMNLRSVRADIAAALDVVLLDCKPDELYRAFIGLSFSRLLEFQLDVLMTALAHKMMCSCGFVPEAWAN